MKTSILKKILVSSLLILSSLVPMSFAAADAILDQTGKAVVRIQVLHGGKVQSEQIGFIINNETGHVATYSGKLGKDSTVSITTASNHELKAEVVLLRPEEGVAILRTNLAGMDVDSVLFAKDPLEDGRTVATAVLSGSAPDTEIGIRRGSVGQMVPAVGTGKPVLIQHNALVNTRSFGAPLFNNCGEVGGLLIPEKRALTAIFGVPDAQEEGVAYAISGEWLKNLLLANDIPYYTAEETCASEIEQVAQAEGDVERAEEEIRAANERLDELRRQLEEAGQASAEERARLKEEIKKAEASVQALKKKQKELEAQAAELAERAEAVRKRERQVTIAAAVVVAILLLLVFLAWRRKRRALQEKQAADRARQETEGELEKKLAEEAMLKEIPDVLLEAESPDGEKFAVKIPGPNLGGAEGATVGRNPEMSNFVINHPDVSRTHFRLLSVRKQLLIEDLGSTNGTSINGILLGEGELEAVMNGTVIRIGDLRIKVTIKQ